MTYIPYLGTFFSSRYPSVALARNNHNCLPDHYQGDTCRVQARRLKKSFLFGHLFFNTTKVFCAKNTGGACACICPRMVTG